MRTPFVGSKAAGTAAILRLGMSLASRSSHSAQDDGNIRSDYWPTLRQSRAKGWGNLRDKRAGQPGRSSFFEQPPRAGWACADSCGKRRKQISSRNLPPSTPPKLIHPSQTVILRSRRASSSIGLAAPYRGILSTQALSRNAFLRVPHPFAFCAKGWAA